MYQTKIKYDHVQYNHPPAASEIGLSRGGVFLGFTFVM